MPTDYGYREVSVKYEDCWDSRRYSQGGSAPEPFRSAPSPALCGGGLGWGLSPYGDRREPRGTITKLALPLSSKIRSCGAGSQPSMPSSSNTCSTTG